MAFRRAPDPRLGGFGLALALAVGSWLAARPGLAAGNDGAEPARDAGLPTAPTSPAEDPRAQHIRDLVAGALDPRLEPQSLFDVSLEDEAAVQAEVLRLRALLARIDEAAARPTGGGSRGTARGVGLDDGGPSAELRAQARRLFEARLETDRAQLAFYELERARRTALLRDHAARRAASLPAESEAERSRRVLEEERARALEAARVARSEAERAVSEEQARLLALEADVRAVRAGFERSREALAVRRDATLGWQRRAREARGAGPVEADATYDALRRALRAARDELAEALSTLGRRDSSVPELGPDPLRDIPGDVSREAQLALRASLADTIAEARRAERSLLEDRAAALLEQVDALNRERLALLPKLSPAKRDATVSLTPEGWDQARAEARHLALILRYHRHHALAWLGSVRAGNTGGITPWRAAATLAPLILLALAFAWARPRLRALLEWADGRLAALDRAAGRSRPTALRRALRVLLKVQGPATGLLALACARAALPGRARDLLEVQLLSSVLAWALTGAVVVQAINELASGGMRPTPAAEAAARLRLRSLRLVGRTVVMYALVLVLSARLVGEGTIHRWVLSTAGLAVVPVLLLLLRWWREPILERHARARRKGAVDDWIAARRTGAVSLLAAAVAAVSVATSATMRVVQRRISHFDLVRRAHAYLFKREIERLGGPRTRRVVRPLPAQALAMLHPDRPSPRWVPCPSDGLRRSLVERDPTPGSVIVIAAARGMGKTTLLDAVAAERGTACRLSCHADLRVEELESATRGAPSLVLLDDVETLIEPRIGGLARFDAVVALARAGRSGGPWVLAIDAAVWPLLRRARDSRPLFDETHVLLPWNEAQLGALLAERNQAAGVVPSYDDLLEPLPQGADEMDREEARRDKRVGYERMLWDYVGGNPGLALEVWRSSLGQDAEGNVLVRQLDVPDLGALEALHDASLFVLRAVLQLSPATVEAVARATRLSPAEVLQHIGFGRAHGLYEEQAGRVRVSWRWLRAATRLLGRRHLLVSL